MAAQNCDILLAALKEAQQEQAKIGSDLATAKTEQTAAKQKAANAQARIDKANSDLEKERQRLAIDDAALNAAKSLHPTSAADQASLAQAVQQYQDDLVRQLNDINADLTNIQNAKADMNAADAANSKVNLLQTQYDSAQGRTNAAQRAYDACRNAQLVLTPPTSDFQATITTSTGTVNAPEPPPLTASFDAGQIVSPGDFSSSDQAVQAGVLSPPPTQVTSTGSNGTTITTTVETPAPSAQAPTFTSSFYNPSLGGFVGPTRPPTTPAAGTTTFGLPGNSQFNSSFLNPFAGDGIVVTGGVTPSSGTLNSSFTAGNFASGGQQDFGSFDGGGIVVGGGGSDGGGASADV